MNSEKIAGALAAVIGAVVLAAAFFYGPHGGKTMPVKQVLELPKAPTNNAPAAKGPVIREIPQ
jgi:hypothetical protein